MNKILTIVFICLFINVNIAQNNLIFNYNNTGAGRNISLVFSKEFLNKNEVGLGLRFNINKNYHVDNQNNVYYNRQHALETIHFFGIHGFYHRQILTNIEKIKPFIFYDAQFSYSPTRNRSFLPYGQDTIFNKTIYKESQRFQSPFHWLEQNIGLGFKAKIYGNWHIYQKLGMGTMFIMGYDRNTISAKYFEWFSWEFGPLVNIGVAYKFSK
jgi:hypothetical protein